MVERSRYVSLVLYHAFDDIKKKQMLKSAVIWAGEVITLRVLRLFKTMVCRDWQMSTEKSVRPEFWGFPTLRDV